MSAAPAGGLRAPARRVVRAVAAFDGLVTAALAVPPLARAFVAGLYALEADGGAGAPDFAPVHWLFVQLAGVLGVLWAAVRLAWPEARLAVADAAGRVVVAGLLLGWLAEGGVPRALLLFVGTELGGAAAVLAALRRDGGVGTAPGAGTAGVGTAHEGPAGRVATARGARSGEAADAAVARRGLR